jgi:hypothetical protein
MYWQTTIGGNPSPTVAEGATGSDSTESTLAESTEPTPSYRRRTKAKGSKRSWLKEHWLNLVVVIVIPLVGWILYQLYSLNREVGEVRVKMDGFERRELKRDSDDQHQADQTRQEIDRLNDRMNALPQPVH